MSVQTSTGTAAAAGATAPSRPRRAPRGPNDPGRRDRIAAAALRVALEQGVGSVSHRNVAAAAGVPLGSTTYHFRGLDDLLGAAMELCAASYAELLVVWSESVPQGADIADALCDLLVARLDGDRERVVAEYELQLVALRRPDLQSVSRAWSELLTLVLAQHVDQVTARELTTVADGVMVNALAGGSTPRRPDLYELLSRLTR
ncbi:TetR/AcrR family transcriptional regulator [Conexibacter sp. CPCC 206217]|uniref:TetR/AcrR family transcriptional regulator n=1 Tax=Conexibacter sp. CPCC 206217 TaxID=3064574 RepID=UPI002719D17C|nr:TetR family transcriptional regulator [Conexibacter sp. CPCC 206217]MDO8210869.1 TetR family transcriptional regulator [Conexibacter sp. CPCC 206217]